MPRLEYSERFADDLADVPSSKVEAHILTVLDCIAQFGEFGSTVVRPSIRDRFGDVRKVPVAPYDLLYTLYPDQDLARIEALIPQRRIV